MNCLRIQVALQMQVVLLTTGQWSELESLDVGVTELRFVVAGIIVSGRGMVRWFLFSRSWSVAAVC